MKVMICHNYYQQRGGEDQSCEDEVALLKSRGHEVVPYTVHNNDIAEQGKLKTALNTFWNRTVRSDLAAQLKHHRPDVIHCTNLFPQLSPAVYYAAREANTPVVQALRNYRIMCPAFSFLRNGKVCEKCATKTFAWPAIMHGCYRNSRLGSAVVAGAFGWHRMIGTFSKMVSHYFTLTEFARRKFIAGGIPADKISVKSNSISPDIGRQDGTGGYAVFVGRLSEEKGIQSLLDAWQRLPDNTELRIIGDGPLAPTVQQAASLDPRIVWMGKLPLEALLGVVGDARFLICSSIWYETFGRVIAEAYSVGTPVVVSNLGAMAELVEHEKTGLLFEAGNSQSLADAVTQMNNNTATTTTMRQAARRAYESKFTEDRNYDRLMEIYEIALSRSKYIFKNEPVPAPTLD